jgi:hypothetical protein
MNIVGLDIGTMNICSAKTSNSKEECIFSTSRNMFIEVDTGLTSISEIKNTELDYISMNNGEKDCLYIISEDCLRFSQIFGQTPRRPMSDGVISSTEIDGSIVMKSIIERMIGKTKDGYCVYSVPAAAVDRNIDITYHKKLFSRVLKDLGYDSSPLNEGMGVIFSECENTKYTGVAMSFGCGMTNIAVSYRGLDAFDFSIARGGDYIDSNVSKSLGIPISRITGIKENKLDLTNPTKNSKNRRESIVLEALYFYYQELIDHVIKIFFKEFSNKSSSLEIENAVPIILSGGTCLPNGFDVLFNKVLKENGSFPYNISEVRRAKDPLESVARGNLIYALWENKKKDQESNNESKKVENNSKIK